MDHDAGSLKVSSTVSALGYYFTLYQGFVRNRMVEKIRAPQLSSAQKLHVVAAESNNTTLPPPPPTPASKVTPAGQGSNASSDPDVDIASPDSDGPEEDEPATQTGSWRW